MRRYLLSEDEIEPKVRAHIARGIDVVKIGWESRPAG